MTLSSCRAARPAAVVLVFLLSVAVFAQEGPPAKPLRPVTLADLYSELTLVSAAISPSGRYVASIARLESSDVLVIFDLTDHSRKVIQRVQFDEAGKGMMLYMLSAEWKTDDKLLLRLRVRPEDMINFYTVSSSRIAKLGDRLFAIDRATGKAVGLLAGNRNAALEGAFDLGDVKSLLPNDPKHILMELNGFNGRSLFKVDLDSGRGEQIERPMESVTGWWLDLNGNPVVRTSIVNRTVRLHRKDENGRWKEFYRMRLRDAGEGIEFKDAGPSNDPDKYYVLAHPGGHDRVGVYLYDLKNESFGEPVFEHPIYDVNAAMVSRDGTRIVSYCYTAHVLVCDFTDPKINAHMKGLRKFFEETANLFLLSSSDDDRNFILHVDGPHDPPGYFYYQVDKKDIQSIGTLRQSLTEVAIPRASVFTWRTRDGKDLSGYLTLPVKAPAQGAKKLPLIVHPHGGPEVRDSFAYNPWVQFFAARGYAVFQPNFRGSDGFGRAFAESGYGQWGRAMQDDITDGVKALVEAGTIDASKVCIVGASYGGYAALAGAALTPDVYRCSVSIAGISDLDDMITWTKRTYGSDSKIFEYVLKVMGDPDQDAERIRAVSPAQQAGKVRIPVLLIHGTEDGIVPIAQSRTMKKALDKAGMKTELLELEGEGHSAWENFNEVRVLNAIDRFLWEHLGPGYGVTQPPRPPPKSK